MSKKEKNVTINNKYYINANAVAVGRGVQAHSNVLNQMFPEIDLNELSNELRELRLALKRKSLDMDDAAIDGAVGSAAKAEIAMKENNGSKVIEYLKEGGKVLKDMVTDIAAKTIAEIIK